MTTDLLERARQRRADLRRGAAVPGISPAAGCEISEESRADGGLISHISLISQSVPAQTGANDPLLQARRSLRELRDGTQSGEAGRGDRDAQPDLPIAGPVGGSSTDTDCEISEKSEISPAGPPGSTSAADPCRAWRLRNAELLAEADGRLGHDYGGYCAEHRRVLSYPEQKRGACSWCVPVDPEREPEYWASHWRRFTEGL
jgi:hypothetical protein